MSQDPRPWLETGAPSAELESLLQSARGDEPTAAQLSGVAAKLGPLLGAQAAATGTAVAGKTAAGAAVKSGVALKVIAAIGTVAAIGGAFQAGRVYEEKTAPPKVVERVVTVTVPAPVPEVPPVVEPRPEPEPEVAAPKAVVKPAAARPEGEAVVLEAAMGALNAGDFAKALAACERHARTYGANGLLVQEREVIAIEALVRLGKKSDAKARAEKFKQAFPTSTHLLKVESLVGE